MDKIKHAIKIIKCVLKENIILFGSGAIGGLKNRSG